MNFKAFLLITAAAWGLSRVAMADPVVEVSSPMAEPAAAPEPFVWPVTPKSQGKSTIVSKFGPRKVPVNVVPPAPATEPHEGIDFAVPAGTAVKAARSGKVLFAGFSKSYTQRADKKQQNRLVIVRHADGTSSRYVHLGALKVRPPQEVKAGDILGTVDDSDEGATPVLHFEIRSATGKALNPLSLLTVSP